MFKLLTIAVAMVAATVVAPRPLSAPAAAQAALAGVQDRIVAASRDAARTKTVDAFDIVENSLKAVPAAGQAGYYKAYWTGYLRYQKSLALMRLGRREDARAVLANAIAGLKAIPTNDVEVNALLGLATGLNLQFVPRPQIVVAAQESGGYVRAGITGAKPSLRAYYAGAIADWNTPVIYGGQQRAEQLAKKAIAATDPASRVRPTWGRDEAMALLVRIYAAGKRTNEAQALLQAGRRQYPDSLALTEVAGQL